MNENKTFFDASDELAVFLEESNFKERFLELIEKHEYRTFREEIAELPAADIAEIIAEVPKERHAIFFRLLPKDSAAEAFVYMDAEMQKNLINSFTDRELSEVMSEIYIDDTVDIIEEMPANVVKRILRAASADERSVINKLLCYPKDSAGSLMTTEYVRFKQEMTVEEALIHIRRVAIDKETIYTCYVTDENRRLIGIVTAKELLISEPDKKLTEIMEENVIFVGTGDEKESVAYMFEKYGFLALPVVDNEKRLVGIITLDDALGVISDAAEEDFAKMAAITPTEEAYLKTPTYKVFKARIPWLFLLMLSSSFASAILSRFEGALPAVLLLFAPMLMGTGGNAGAQSSVTVIRGLSLGELSFKVLPRVIFKELRLAFFIGLSLGIGAFLKLMLLDRLIMQNSSVTLGVSLVVAISLALVIVASKLVGASLPLLAKKIGLDPAVMASPVITTLVDVISLVLYFVVANGFFSIYY